MKTYLRLLAYTRPFTPTALKYGTVSIFAIIFGLANFTLLIPFLDVLFNKVDVEQIIPSSIPEFQLTVEYAKSVFNYYFLTLIKNSGELEALKLVCFLLIASNLIKNVATYLGTRILADARAKVVENLRRDFFNKIINLHYSFFNDKRKGDIVARLTNDIQEIEHSIVYTFTIIFREPLTLFSYIFLLVNISLELTLFSLIVLPVSGLFIGIIAKKLRKHTKRSQETVGLILSVIEETLGGLKVIKAFSAEKFISDRFNQVNSNYSKSLRSIAYRADLASPFSETFGILSIVILIFYGGQLVLSGSTELTASEFLAYLLIFSQVLTPIKAISNTFTIIQRGITASDRIFSIMDTPTQVMSLTNAPKKKSFEHSIEFKHVEFTYPNSTKKVLKDLSFTLPKGQSLALVGPSGGGKSTISDLVLRFYDPEAGEILIDGASYTQLDIYSIRNLIGIVTQDCILFNDTIYNNIVFGLEGCTEEDVVQAAKIANAHEFILASENGYQTNIGDRGLNLSGGQRQRISIARALLKNPPILILDEATSALDTESEKLVQESINLLMKNRTSIIIAHRLSTIQNVDTILVIDQGQIVEMGNHQELISIENGVYKKLTEMQQINN